MDTWTYGSVGVSRAPAELGVKDTAERTGDYNCLHRGAFERGIEDPDSALHRRLEEFVSNILGANDQRRRNVSEWIIQFLQLIWECNEVYSRDMCDICEWFQVRYRKLDITMQSTHTFHRIIESAWSNNIGYHYNLQSVLHMILIFVEVCNLGRGRIGADCCAYAGTRGQSNQLVDDVLSDVAVGTCHKDEI